MKKSAMILLAVVCIPILGCHDMPTIDLDGATLGGGEVVVGSTYSKDFGPEIPKASGGEVVVGDSYSPGFQPDLETLQQLRW